jgi:hypothetical protein
MLPRSRPSILCVFALFLCACHGSDSSGGPLGAGPLANLGFDVDHLASDGRLLVVGVSEPGNGGTLDQNGDGDTLDEVAFAFDLETGTEQNLGITLSPRASVPLRVVGDLAVFVESEEERGNTDLNGDGDALDDVLAIYDHEAGARVGPRLALASIPPQCNGFQAVFFVSEQDEGNSDLNGDGDALDVVLRVFDRSDGSTYGPDVAVETLIASLGFFTAFTTDEAQLGGDLNGDGDAVDGGVLQTITTLGPGHANSGLVASAVAPIGNGPRLDISTDWIVLVDERAQGLDLDGDGDLDDLVAHFLTFTTSADIGIACIARAPVPTFGMAALFAREGPGLDRNRDGDFDDVTLVVAGPRSRSDVDTRLAVDPVRSGVAWSAGQLAIDVSEAAQGRDLDGDGDTFDLVVHLFDGATGEIRNLALDSQGLVGAPAHVLFARSELDSGNDWNRDGDLEDEVLSVTDPRTGRTRNSGVAGIVLDTSAGRLLLGVSELVDGRDWNRDGDRDDFVYVLHDLVRSRSASLGVTGAFPGSGELLAEGRTVVLVDEASEGADLNGDGDLTDSVPRVFE